MATIAELLQANPALLAPPPAPDPAPLPVPAAAPSKSPLGFLGNLVGDFPELFEGLKTLIGTVATDAGKAVADPFVAGDFDYATDDIVKGAIPAIIDDYKSRYGSVEGFKEGAYEDPLSYLLDIGSIFSMGGTAAARAAQVASKAGAVGKVGTIADDLARLGKGAATLDEVGSGARLVKKILPGAGIDGAPLGGTTKVLDEAGGIYNWERPMNPVKRVFEKKITDKLLTKPIDKVRSQTQVLDEGLQGNLDAMRSTVDLSDVDPDSYLGRWAGAANDPAMPGGPGPVNAKLIAEATTGAATRDRLGYMLDVAENQGASRVYRSLVSEHKIKKAADKLVGHSTAGFLLKREKATGEYRAAMTRLAKDGGAPAEVENFTHSAMFNPPKSAGRMVSDVISDTIVPGTTLMDNVLEPLTQAFGASGVLPDGRVIIGNWDQFDNAVAKAKEVLEPMHGPAEVVPPGAQGATATFLDGTRLQFQTPKVAAMADDLKIIDEDIAKLTAEGADELEIRRAHEYKESLGEGIVSDMNSQGQTPLANAFDDIRWATHRAITGEALRKRVWGENSYTRVVDRQFVPTRKARDGILDDDLTVAQTDELQALASETGSKTPLYIPMSDPRLAKRSDFLFKRGTQGMAAQRPGPTKRAMGHLIDRDENGKLSYIGETDPVEALSRATSQMLSMMEARDLAMDVAKKFGRELDPSEARDFLSAEERLFNPEGLNLAFASRQKIEGAIADRLQEGSTIEDAFAEGLQEVMPKIQENVLRIAQGDKKLYAVPKVVAKRLEAHLTGGKAGGTKARLFADGPMNVWRSLVLQGSPRWVVNNTIGNTTFLKMQGGKLSDVLRIALSPSYRKRVEELFPEEASGGFFGSGEQYTRNLGAAADTWTGKKITKVQQSGAMKGPHAWGRLMSKTNTKIEEAFREASYLSAMDHQLAKRGAKKTMASFFRSKKSLHEIAENGADETLVSRSIDELNYFLNDYKAGTPFERNVVRRFVMPFWSFQKHVLKLSLSYPLKHPNRANALKALGEFSQEMGADLGELPDWLEGATPIEDMWAAPGEDTRFYNPTGANPFSSLLEGPQAITNSLNPAIKIALEQALGRDLFTGKQFTSPDVNQPFGSDRQFDSTGEEVTVRPGIFEALLGTIPQYDMVRDLMPGGGARHDTGGLLGTGETMEDPSGQPLYPSDPIETLLKWSGVGTQTFNVAEYQAQLEKEKAAALVQAASR